MLKSFHFALHFCDTHKRPLDVATVHLNLPSASMPITIWKVSVPFLIKAT